MSENDKECDDILFDDYTNTKIRKCTVDEFLSHNW
jgi:hypothetical protein